MTEQETTPKTAYDIAMVKAQSEFPTVGKKATAGQGNFTYDYAELEEIQKAILPVLNSNDFYVEQCPTLVGEVGGGYTFVVRTVITHGLGHERAGYYPLPDPSKTKAQDMGSAITYAKRYSLAGALCITLVGEDDDGKKAQESGATVAPAPPPKVPKDPVQAAHDWATGFEVELNLTQSVHQVNAMTTREQKTLKRLAENHMELWQTVDRAIQVRRKHLSTEAAE